MTKSDTTNKKGTRTVKTRMICLECDHRFGKKIGRNTFEVRCPKCGGYDTDVE